MPILVPVLLSFGSINALIPIIIIIILIAAAGGLMRGYDLFALFGLGALVGVGGAAKKGSIASRNPFGSLAKGSHTSKLPRIKPIKTGIRLGIRRTPEGQGRLPFRLDFGINKDEALNAQRAHVTQKFVNNINKYTKNAIDPNSGMLDIGKLTATNLNFMKRDIAKLYSPYYKINPNNIGVRREGDTLVFFDTRTNDALVRLDKHGAYVETGSGVSALVFNSMPGKAKTLVWSLNTAHDVRQQGGVKMAVAEAYANEVKEKKLKVNQIENALKNAKSGVGSSDIPLLADILANFDVDELKKKAYIEELKQRYEQELTRNKGRLTKEQQYKIQWALRKNRSDALREDISGRKYSIIDEHFKEFDKRVQSIVNNPNLSDKQKLDMINKERAWLVRAISGTTDIKEIVKSIASGNFEEAAREFYNAPRILYPTKEHFSNLSNLSNVPKAGSARAAISTVLSTVSSVFSMTEAEKRELAKTKILLEERKEGGIALFGNSGTNVALLGKDKVTAATLGEDQDKVKAATLEKKMRDLEKSA
ncbi:MAG: hypothetical protein ACP5GD_01685 [Candidatus Micrarchaeia archaeon]